MYHMCDICYTYETGFGNRHWWPAGCAKSEGYASACAPAKPAGQRLEVNSWGTHDQIPTCFKLFLSFTMFFFWNSLIPKTRELFGPFVGSKGSLQLFERETQHRALLRPPQWNMLGGLPVVLGLWLARSSDGVAWSWSCNGTAFCNQYYL